MNTVPLIAKGSATATFTRNTANNYTKLASGLWGPVAANVARSCYTGANTAVGPYGGYLAEGAGVQLVTPNASIRDMTDASWVAVNVTPAKTGTGIDGVVNSCSRLTSAAIGGAIQQTLVAAATSRTYSCWIRRVSGTGTITINQGATTSDITAQINSTTYTRVALTASVLNAAFGITFGASGDVIEVDFNQFESGSDATSPMASAGAARNGDVLTYAGAGNIASALGSCYCEYSTTKTSLDGNPLGQGGNAIIRLFVTETLMQDTSGFRHFATIVPVNTGAITKMAARWSDANSSANVIQSGVAGVPTAWVSNWVLTTFGINCAGNNSQQLLGMVKNISIYGAAFSDASLQVMTS